MNALLIRVDLRRMWIAAAFVALVWVTARSFGSGVLDLQVYLAGGDAWWDGTNLYSQDFTAPNGLPFTYPVKRTCLLSSTGDNAHSRSAAHSEEG